MPVKASLIRVLPTVVVLASMSWVALSSAGCNGGGRTVIECGGGGEFICPAGLYCELGEGCGGMDRRGTCRPLAHDCPTTAAPVCGCDGKRYENACYANGAGITVHYEGPCMAGR